VVGRDGTGRKVARSVTSCAECLAWGMTYCQGVCLACYNFAARYRGHGGECAACQRRVPLKEGYCRLCWCQARYDRAVGAADARSAVVLAPWLPRVRHRQLFFAGMDSRRAAPRALPRRHGEKGRPLKPPPALLAWSAGYDHLREVTRDDVLSYIADLHGHERSLAVSALRSLFTWAKKTGAVFRNPAARIRLGKREHAIWQPLTSRQLAEAAAAAATPQARLCLVLAAVHAARPGVIRALQLDDADLGSGRLRLAGTDRPMGELTGKVLREWLEYRHRRWPHTANPHLLVSKESALHHGPVSAAYLTSLRGLPAALERLRIDCQLAEAMATGFDPLHLAEVFGISEQTAIRYAVNARQLTRPADHEATPGPGSNRPPRPAR
jgi:hypothetical protein